MIWSTGGSVTDSMVLPVTSGHVSNTSCESCEFVVRSGSLVAPFDPLLVDVVSRQAGC